MLLQYRNNRSRIMAGMGKMRPVGQIRPAKVFCTARGEGFLTVFHVKCNLQLVDFQN